MTTTYKSELKPQRLPEQREMSEEERQRRREAAIALLQSWQDADEEDTQDQHDTYEYLVQALNADLLPGQRRRL